MSTKRLSRTIIEGGKRGFDKHERKLQIQKNRRAGRDFCQTYSDENDTELLHRKGKHYYREFNDCLSPLRKFIEAHVGQPWNDVWSKLCSMADRGNIRGWHFLDHAKAMLFNATGAKESYWGLYIDDEGILRDKPIKRHNRSNFKKEREMEHLYYRWWGDRRVRMIGTIYFWFDPVKKTTRYIDGEYRTYVAAWRQNEALDKKEIGHMEWLKDHFPRVWKRILSNKE
jgi:hypothetical protein